MKNLWNNNNTGYKTTGRGSLRKLLSGFLAIVMVFILLGGHASIAFADEQDAEYALAGAASGQNFTIHFGNREGNQISIHVNSESGEKGEAFAESEGYELDDETEAETETELTAEMEAEDETEIELQTEIEDETEPKTGFEDDPWDETESETEFEDETEAETELSTGIKELEAGGIVTISPVDGGDLPEEAVADAAIVEGAEAIAAVEAKVAEEDGQALPVGISTDTVAPVAIETVASGTNVAETIDGENVAVEDIAGEKIVTAETDAEENAVAEAAAEETSVAESAASETTAGESETGSGELAENVEVAQTQYQVFDISLDGVDTEQYEDGFKVSVVLPEDIRGARDFRLYHIHGDEEPVEIELSTVGKVDRKTGDEIVSGFEFVTDGFSEFVLSYTVDFEYEWNSEMYRFSLSGGEKITLSELVEVLGILNGTNYESVDEFIADVQDVEFSDPELVKVTKKEKVLGVFGSEDWVLESLKPFDTEETLTIVMKGGEKIVVKVTDAQDTTSPWDLANEDNTQWLHVSVESSVTQNEQERDAVFKLHFTYQLEEDVVRAIDAYSGNPVLVYDLSDLIATSPLDIQNSVMDISIGNRKLGTCTFRDGVAYLEFTDPTYFDGRTDFTGWFDLTAQTNETELGTNDQWTYEFPGTGDSVTVHYKQTVENGTKSVYSTQDADGNYTLHYTANININSDLDSLVFNDTISGLQTLDASSVKINGTAVNVNQTGNGFNFNVASALGTTGVAKGSYRVTYDTKVTAAQLEAMSNDKTTENNTASWTVNGDKTVPGGNTTIEINKPVPPIPVEKTQSSSGTNQPGDTITYTVTYGDANTALSGFHISDSITDVVIPQGTNVTLNYGNGQTVTVPFNSQATDSNYSKGTVTLFDYTFPDGTQGTGPVTVTYSVMLIDAETAKDNVVYDSTSVVNMAVEHRQNTSDTETTTVTYQKEPTYTVDKTATANPTDENGKWLPGSIITYTLTIGDANTNMAGVNIKDVMTDLQTLQGDIMIKVGNGSQVRLSDYVSGAITWSDDGRYSSNDVELFNFNMPSNAGNGPVVITYTTKVITQEQATANGIYGDMAIKNTGYGGKQHDGTSGTGPFNPYPIEKTVTKANVDVNGQTVQMEDTVHYTLTFGDSSMNMGGVTIYDEMTDLQKLVGNITIKKADGSTYTMPIGSGQWASDGVVWNYFDDEKYSTNNVRVFNYMLPSDIGNGPITVEYDVQIISEDEANDSGIKDTKDAYNTFRINNHQAQTDVKIDFPTDPKKDTQVTKEFNNDWDIDNNTLYWDITVEKTSDSAYPIENVTVREFWNERGIVIKNESIEVWYYAVNSGEDFDLINAVVTTDDGTVLTPGVDYSINKETAAFTFAQLNERVHIHLPFHSPVQISNGFTMHNVVRLDNDKRAEADATYTNPNVEIIKNGNYSENSRIMEWEVQLNPSAIAFEDSNPLRVMFSDKIPAGLKLLNYSTSSEENPTVFVQFPSKGYSHPVSVTVNETNEIEPVDIAAHNAWGNQEFGLNGNKIIIKYRTKLSDEEWERITSSGSGSGTYENKVTVTAGDNQSFEASDIVTVTSDEYLKKYDTTSETNNGVVIDSNGNTSKNITYKIDINPHGYTLNSGNTLTLTDYISTNMDLDTSSVKLYTATMGDDGKLIPGTEQSTADIVSYNDDSRLLAIREIPDGTPMVLEYTCIARAQGEGTFTNTATLIGGGSHSSSTTETHNVQTNDAGVRVDGVTINLHKIDENNIALNLADAKFQLYECKLQIGELTNIQNYDTQWWENLLTLVDKRTAGNATPEEIAYIDEQFKIIEHVPVGDPVVTGASGYTQWPSLSEHKLYAWKEVEAPENYTGSEDYHYFVAYQHIDVNSDELPQPLLSDQEQLARKHAAWALDDASQFANGIRVASISNLTTWTATNIHHPYTAISATKVWQGDSDNLFETRPKDGIKLQLVRINSDGTRENYGDPVAINVDESGNWPSYIWNRLLVEDEQGNPYKYTVVESRVDGYSTTYSDDGEGQISGTITVTNKMIPKSTDIHVKKVFSDAGNDNLPNQIHVTLMKIRTDKDGNVSTPVEVRDAMLTASNDWEYSFEKLDTTEEIDSVPYYLTYTVVEDTAALEQQGFNYVVTYSDNGEGVIEAPADDPLVITNSEPKGSVKVTKEFSGIDSLPEGFKITATYEIDGETHSIEFTPLSEGVTGNGTSGDPYTWEITGLPIDTVVTFVETGYEVDGKVVTVRGSGTAANPTTATATAAQTPGEANFVNTYEEGKTELSFYKEWKNATQTESIVWPDNTSITVNLGKVGTSGEVQTLSSYNITKAAVEAGSDISPVTGEYPNLKVNKEVIEGSDVPAYRFTLEELDVLEDGYSYVIVEENVGEGYKFICYKNTSNQYITDGGTIVNGPVETYELPSTGGPGTQFLTILGSILIASAGIMLLLRRRRLITISNSSKRGGDPRI